MIDLFARARDYLEHIRDGDALGRMRIHPTLPVVVVGLAMLFPIACWIGVASWELATVGLTFPAIWLGSVFFRFAAQQWALGDYARDTQFVVGPVGNQSIDYEYLPRNRLLAYAAAGQLASLMLALVGLVVVSATLSASTQAPTGWANLLDFRGGWNHRALGSQVLWFNLFLLAIHALPTVPFDTRAAVFSVIRRGQPMTYEPRVLRAMGSVDNFIGAMALGGGVTLLCVALIQGTPSGWYALVGLAILLFVAGRWEVARADEAEQKYEAKPAQPKRRRLRPAMHGPHFTAKPEGIEPASNDRSTAPSDFEDYDALSDEFEKRHRDHAFEDFAESDASPGVLPIDETLDADGESEFDEPPLDVDEILRKLHRDGADSLSEPERETLMTASRQLNDRRQKG